MTRPAPVGRLAPSPTGGLHLGHARTFLVAWLSARSQGGRVIYRVEDLDASRVRPESIPQAMTDLRWLGLDWDAGPDLGGPDAPYVQSERASLYDRALDRLKAAEAVYPCTCTRADIERAASAPHPEDEGPTYPGTCASRSARDADSLVGRPFAWRFRVPPGRVGWEDRFRGWTDRDPARLGGDFVVGRAEVGAAYQLAVVVDDAAMGVSEVVRGDDLIPSTPRQLLLYQALGLTPPSFVHMPLAVASDGKRLAKRDGALKLATLRASGVDPTAIIGRIARSCGWSDQVEPSMPPDWLDRFNLATIPRDPWIIPPDGIMATG